VGAVAEKARAVAAEIELVSGEAGETPAGGRRGEGDGLEPGPARVVDELELARDGIERGEPGDALGIVDIGDRHVERIDIALKRDVAEGEPGAGGEGGAHPEKGVELGDQVAEAVARGDRGVVGKWIDLAGRRRWVFEVPVAVTKEARAAA